MDDPGTLATLGRLAVAAFVMIAPTVLFLGLVRGLERLRDDAVIERWHREQGREIENDVLTVLTRGIGLEADGDESGRCPACGSVMTGESRVCDRCLEGVS